MNKTHGNSTSDRLRTAAKRKPWVEWRKRLHSATGAIDLASIMIGVLVIGVIAATIAATVTVVIPWSQDAAARGNLDAVRTAQSVAKVQDHAYLNGTDLVARSLIQDSDLLTVATDPDGTCYVAVAQSASSKLFWLDSAGPEAHEYVVGESSSSCIGLAELVPGGVPESHPFKVSGVNFDLVVPAPGAIISLLPNADRAFTFAQPALDTPMVLVEHPSNPSLTPTPEIHLESALDEDATFTLAQDGMQLGSCTVVAASTACAFGPTQIATGHHYYGLTANAGAEETAFSIDVLGATLEVSVAIVAVTSSGWENINEATWTDFSNSELSLPGSATTMIALLIRNNGNTTIDAEVAAAGLSAALDPGMDVYAHLSGLDLVSALEGSYGAGFTATSPTGYSTSGGVGGTLVAQP